mmetsp:Transcript_16342/g.38667  ORF Transcript_16342/g.38667 Transcript_16342/m.38667 type:complete len:484 (-) Transcript_16342:120-1571(-)
MATVAAGAAASAACCGLSCCAGLTCQAITACCCSRSLKAGRRATKVFYLMMLVVSVVVALLLRYYAKDIYCDIRTCTATDPPADASWYGDQAVYRVSFSLGVFFLCMVFGSMSDSFERSYWGIKVLGYIATLVASFFIPNSFFASYSDLARAVSAIFLIFTVIILVDFAYNLQEGIIEKAEAYKNEQVAAGNEEPGTCSNSWLIIYLVLAGILFIVTMAGLAGMYAFAVNQEAACGGSVSMLSLTLLGGLILTIMSTLQMFGGRGLLPPLVVWVYCVYLVWSAFTSNPTYGCNPLAIKVDGVYTVEDSPGAIALGLIITALSLAYAAHSAASAVPGMMNSSKDDEMSQSLIDKEEGVTERLATGEASTRAEAVAQERREADEEAGESGDEAGAAAGTEAAAEEDAPQKGTWLYHAVMCTAAIYMAMLLTDWGDDSNASAQTLNVSKPAMTVKLLSAIVTMLLYFWTLIAPLVAPKCCPGRDFS